jgi:hypothetical protein
MRWPIDNRSALIRIFAAGPLAGVLASSLVLVLGFAASETTLETGPNFVEFGDSLLTLAVQRIVFPGKAESEEILLHPVGLAGYVGLHFTAWQLFPAGRLDGGRVAYALLGYRGALRISWVTIVVLLGLGMLSPVWPVLGVFAALTLIGLKRQHPIDVHSQPLDANSTKLVFAMVVAFAIIFIPVAARAV